MDATSQQRDDLNGWLTLGGAGTAVVGSLLPWAQVTAPFIGTVSKAGTEGDGLLTLGAGIMLGILGIAFLRGTTEGAAGVVVMLIALVGCAICVYDLIDIQKRFSDVDTQYVKANVGVGLLLTGLGLGIAVIGGLRQFTLAPPKNEPSEPPQQPTI